MASTPNQTPDVINPKGQSINPVIGGQILLPPDETPDPHALPKFPEDFKGGEFKYLKTGENYLLCIHPETPHNEKTHTLKNKVHTWQGNLSEFKNEFEKL